MKNELGKAFEIRTRESSGETFYALADDAPEWLRDAVHDAHGSLMPDDWTYAVCAHVVDAIVDGEADEWELGRAVRYELADSLSDIYTADLLAWLSNDLGNVGRVDDALENGATDLVGAITTAQCDAIAEIVAVLVEAFENNEQESEES